MAKKWKDIKHKKDSYACENCDCRKDATMSTGAPMTPTPRPRFAELLAELDAWITADQRYAVAPEAMQSVASRSAAAIRDLVADGERLDFIEKSMHIAFTNDGEPIYNMFLPMHETHGSLDVSLRTACDAARSQRGSEES